ncbi:MAG: hypothetical protein AAF851_05625 [Myxococcota bacterium]
MGESSNVRVFMLSGALVSVGFWFFGEQLPEAEPGIETAIGTVLATLIAWVAPPTLLQRVPMRAVRPPPTIAVLLALGLAGCAGSQIQKGLNVGAMVLVEASASAADFYEARDSTCRERHPPPDVTYWQCMEPVDLVRTSRSALDRSLRAAQAGLDAGGRDGFTAQAPCLLEAAEQLALASEAIEDGTPAQIAELLSFLQDYVGQGDTCER